MRKEKENDEKCGILTKLVKAKYIRKVIVILLIIVAVAIVIIGMKKVIFSESQTTKIGFEDIGELATQSAYCTQVNVTDSSRELFGIDIPFTQSKYIYSYAVNVKAGYNFEEIEWRENGRTLEVELPEAKILSSQIDLDSFKVYHEDESIYNQIKLEETNDALAQLQKTAEEDAIQNGLLENARSNVETILTGFFGNVYDLEEYKIVFKDK